MNQHRGYRSRQTACTQHIILWTLVMLIIFFCVTLLQLRLPRQEC